MRPPPVPRCSLVTDRAVDPGFADGSGYAAADTLLPRETETPLP